MTIVIEKPRNGCALQGALQTAEEIRGAVPIVHSNAGCAMHNYLSNKASGVGKGFINGLSVPGTNVQERHIIFGGASRLREQIKNTVKVIDGDLYIVINSCESAMVGDDIDAMVKEAVEQGEPVIDTLSAGFHGDVHYGYSTLLTDIFGKISEVKHTENKKEARRVNILGILPQQDIYFKGDLAELKRILKGIGVEANLFFGSQNGVQELSEAENASLNLVFSKWGRNAAEKLQKLYGIPFLAFDTVPTGIDEVEDFSRQVAGKLGIAKDEYQEFLKEERENFYYYVNALADEYYEEGYNQKLAIVGDERTVVQTAVFLKKYLGALIETVVITDFFPSDDITIGDKARELAYLGNKIQFSQDTREINSFIAHSGTNIILGSSLEQEAADRTDQTLLEISYPVYKKAIINKTYAGITGAFTLAEDYITTVKIGNQKRKKQLRKMLAFHE